MAAAADAASVLAAAEAQGPRRALLQNGSSGMGNGFNMGHLFIFTALMVGLAFAIVVIGCLCVRFRRWIPSDGINRSSHDGRRPRTAEQPVVLQDVKLKQMPILVVMPGNEVSYAHKLSPEAELAAAFPEPVKRSSADGGGSSSIASGDGSITAIAHGGSGGDSSGATGQPQQQPAGSAADAETLRQQYAPEETAAAAGTAAGEAGAAGADTRSTTQTAGNGEQRPATASQQPGRFQRWSGRSAAAQQLHAERQAARLERRAQELGMAVQRRAEPEVRIVPAFIEWDITSNDGPILHPPPPAPPPELARSSRAAEVAAAEAQILARAASMRSAPRWSMRSAISRTSSRTQDPSRHGGDASAAGGSAGGLSNRPAGGGASPDAAAGTDAGAAGQSAAGSGGGGSGSSAVRAVNLGSNEGSSPGGGRRERAPADADFIARSLFV